MAADLFETYAVTTVATMVLASIFFVGNADMVERLMAYPLAIGGACIITSIIGTYFVKLGSDGKIMWAMYKGVIVAAVLSIPAIWLVTDRIVGMDTVMTVTGKSFTGMSLFWCSLVGLAITGLIVWITEYYTGTDYRPVKAVAQASVTGHGTNVIAGLAMSMEATAMPALLICAGIVICYVLAGLFGIAIATTAMLALAGMVVALDAYGPGHRQRRRHRRDGGPAEGRPQEHRRARCGRQHHQGGHQGLRHRLGRPWRAGVVRGLHLGPRVLHQPGQARHQGRQLLAGEPVCRGRPADRRRSAVPVRRHVDAGGRPCRAVGGRRGPPSVQGEARIMQGTDRPDYGRAVDMLTKAAIKEMMIPSLLPVLSPIVLYFVISAIAGKADAFAAVGAMLLGVIVTGIFVAISMTAGGGAWDNAKKYIEEGHFGGKGSEAHKAAVTGDTVGDPYKDTAGPAVNPMIKITNIVALLLLAVLAH
jgi:K(+)-stimulated pyrophosphate-energized sodium pump